MQLSAGTRLGTYEVVSPLGRGGMGEVYRARDRRLERDVAIKILPARWAQHEERLARFEREARALAALSHPNIAAIHGIESDGSARFLVLELVEGESLAARIARGPIPPDDARRFFVQVAEALQAAHAGGIVHRDVKPANIQVSSDGSIKILDFGLARVTTDAPTAAEDTAAETPVAALTHHGVPLGTPAYMSPEQARGEEADAQSDIWALGVCLYQALCGRLPFDGDSAAEVAAAVLTAEPDWEQLPDSTPSAVRRLLRRCLEKDRRQRLHHAADARLELVDRDGDSASVRRATQQPTALSVVIDHGFRLTGEAESFSLPATISPNGRTVAWAAIRSGRSRLFLRRIDSFESREIPHTQDATSPFFAPDGRSLGFFAHGRLQRVPLDGGPAATLCSAPAYEGVGVDWGEDGFIYFSASALGSGLWRVAESGGVAESITTPSPTERQHGWPQLLPGGRRLLFSVWGGSEDGAAILDLESGQRSSLVPHAVGARYSHSGHLLFRTARSSGVLQAVPVDLGRERIAGSPVPVLDGIDAIPRAAKTTFDVARNGTLLYLPRAPSQRSLVWVDRSGNVTPAIDDVGAYEFPRVSPDGDRLVFVEDYTIWDVDLRRGVRTRQTPEGRVGLSPVWTPDGRAIIYSSVRKGPWNLFRKRIDGGAPELLLQSEDSHFPMSHTRDGSALALQAMAGDAGQTLAVLDSATQSLRPFAAGDGHEKAPSFSPDGRFVAYVSSESGREQVYVKPWPEEDRRWTISSDGGKEPLWSPLGDELFYRSGDAVMAVDVEIVADDLKPGVPRQLFTGRFCSQLFPNYDVAPDGQSFLMVQDDPENERREIRLVLDWFSDLQRLAPG